jgi:hypothetical protein
VDLLYLLQTRYYVLSESDDESDRSLDKHTIVRFSDVQAKCKCYGFGRILLFGTLEDDNAY